MLGTPLAAADTPKQPPSKEAPAQPADAKPTPAKPAKPAPAKPVPATAAVVAELDREVAALVQEINRAISAGEAAQNEADRSAAMAKLAALQKQQVVLTAATKLAKSAKDSQALTAKATTEATAGKTETDRAAAQLVLQRLGQALPGGSEQDLVTRINAAIEAVHNAQSDAERSAAKAKLAALQKEHEAKRKEAEAAKRPRTPAQDRPIGRGFILS